MQWAKELKLKLFSQESRICNPFIFVKILSFFLFLLSITSIFAQEEVLFTFIPGQKIVIREVANLTLKIDNYYVGLLSREESGILFTQDFGSHFKGNFYISKRLKTDARFVERPIEKTVPVEMEYNISTGFVYSGRGIYPSLQNFPVFPDNPVRIGETWRAYSTRYVDPLEKGDPTAVQFYCEYKYAGPVVYTGKKAQKITAQYALRYKNEYNNGDPDLMEIKYAGHTLDIYVFEDGSGIIIIDKLGIRSGSKEEYIYSDGTKVVQSGTIITWIDAAVIMDKQEIIEKIKIKVNEYEDDEIIIKKDELEFEDINVTKVDEGIRLSVKKIHFVADKAEILENEKHRLDLIADILKGVPDRSILIVGHTARVGNEENEQELSELRAKSFVDEMIKRGLAARRFMYEGRGGSEPIADNEIEEGRKQNRRVEIFILDD